MDKFIIGRMPQYFTLWRVKLIPENTTDNIFVGHWLHYEFVKNISKDEAKVRLLYPDAEIADDLKPVDKFITGEWDEPLSDDHFHSGKFFGQSILDCSDMDYLRFVYPKLSPIQKSHAIRTLNEHGYSVIGDIILSRAEMMNIRRYQEFKETLDAGLPFTIFFGTNLNQAGEYVYNGFVFSFNEYSFHYKDDRHGFASLPLNQDVKFIKGRAFRVTGYVRTKAGAIIERMEVIQTTGENPFDGQF